MFNDGFSNWIIDQYEANWNAWVNKLGARGGKWEAEIMVEKYIFQRSLIRQSGRKQSEDVEWGRENHWK